MENDKAIQSVENKPVAGCTANFVNNMLVEHALSAVKVENSICDLIDGKKKDINYSHELQVARDIVESLNPLDAVQLMLATQMAAVHRMQQKIAAAANNAEFIDAKNAYINSVIKLSNAFVQQVNLMQKLKGYDRQSPMQGDKE